MVIAGATFPPNWRNALVQLRSSNAMVCQLGTYPIYNDLVSIVATREENRFTHLGLDHVLLLQAGSIHYVQI